MTISKDQNDQPFGSAEPNFTGKSASSDGLDAAQGPDAGEETEDPGLLGKISQGIRKMLNGKTVEIDGVTMTAAAGKLVGDQGMQFVGAECRLQVPVQGGEQIAGRRVVMMEYLLSPQGDSGRVPGASFAEVHAVRNGVYLGGIGRRLSQDVLRRMQDGGTLSPAGEAMIAQSPGTTTPPNPLSSQPPLVDSGGGRILKGKKNAID